MKKRIREKICSRFLRIDDALVQVTIHLGWDSPVMDVLRVEMGKLRRRYPRLYWLTFYGRSMPPVRMRRIAFQTQ